MAAMTGEATIVRVPDFAPERTFTERVADLLPVKHGDLLLTLLTTVCHDGYQGKARGWLALVTPSRIFRLVPLGSWAVEAPYRESAHEQEG